MDCLIVWTQGRVAAPSSKHKESKDHGSSGSCPSSHWPTQCSRSRWAAYDMHYHMWVSSWQLTYHPAGQGRWGVLLRCQRQLQLLLTKRGTLMSPYVISLDCQVRWQKVQTVMLGKDLHGTNRSCILHTCAPAHTCATGKKSKLLQECTESNLRFPGSS